MTISRQNTYKHSLCLRCLPSYLPRTFWSGKERRLRRKEVWVAGVVPTSRSLGRQVRGVASQLFGLEHGYAYFQIGIKCVVYVLADVYFAWFVLVCMVCLSLLFVPI